MQGLEQISVRGIHSRQGVITGGQIGQEGAQHTRVIALVGGAVVNLDAAHHDLIKNTQIVAQLVVVVQGDVHTTLCGFADFLDHLLVGVGARGFLLAAAGSKAGHQGG